MSPNSFPALGDVPSLKTRTTTQPARRLARSAGVTAGGRGMRTADFAEWLDSRRQARSFEVNRIPFGKLEEWSFERETGNLRHHSGRFFTVEGLRVSVDDAPPHAWEQPIINQPEVGILGILAKEFDGMLHFLMQAKMEPGNPHLLQLSPTVQATRSNYTKVHRGADVTFIDYFTTPGRGRVLADVLQSEHGSWFYRKRNRNMIVEAYGEVPDDPDFCWLTLGQIGALLRESNIVNMDARTVLACAPIDHRESRALLSDGELLSWFTGRRSHHRMTAERIPLRNVTDWRHGDSAISHAHGRYFSVVAVEVRADSREVSRWTQPLFQPHGLGVSAFLTRRIHGVPHVLAHARVEGGFLDTTELGPTVQYTPSNYAHLPRTNRPRYLDTVLSADPGRIRYEAVHSEEGGRFLNAESRYMFVEAEEDDAPLEPPPGYQWITPGQLSALARHSHYVNVQARTLLACLNTGAVTI